MPSVYMCDVSVHAWVQDMDEGDKYTCPLCTRALQQKERKEQRRSEAAAAAEIEQQAREAQAARKAKLVRSYFLLVKGLVQCHASNSSRCCQHHCTP